MPDLWQLDLSGLSTGVAERSFSPTEIVGSFLERIGHHNDALNAYITVTAMDALAQAHLAEQEIDRELRPTALYGLPIGHKDVFKTKDIKTTAGSKVFAEWKPNENAAVVSRLETAGMICLGKLNTHEFAYGPTNENSVAGPTHNPWDLARTTGGSSGGSAAAVAGGLAPAATGSDSGGSVRIPAACCGVTGLKPTYGRVSRANMVPFSWSVDHPGVITRSVKDAALLLETIAGCDEDDASSADLTVPKYSRELVSRVKGVKIGLPRRMFFDQAQCSVVDVVEAALLKFVDLGAELVDIDIPGVEHCATASLPINLAEATAYHGDMIEEKRHLYSEKVHCYLELGNRVLAKDYLLAQRYRTYLGQCMSEVLSNVDVLMTPTIPLVAPLLGVEDYSNNGLKEPVWGALLRNTEPFNLTGLPAVAIPCGLVDGLPVSLQIIGRAFDEQSILNLGFSFQENTDWHVRWPMYK